MNTLPFRALLILVLAAVPAFAVNRTLTVSAPATVRPGSDVHVEVKASTDAVDAEQIGFFHAEYSVDGGKSWVPVYSEKVGRSTARTIDFKAGPLNSTALVRVRVAFRGGTAGDVDFSGKPIAWGDSWGKWTTPPARNTTIHVTAQ